MPDVFELPHHRRIAQILCALDGDLLRRHECFFGGGTAMTLKHHEYRKSLDIDFLCCNLVHYRELRQWLTGPEGLLVLARPGGLGFESRRDVRADAYGIRSVVAVDEVPIKFELVFEGRITFDPPGAADQVCGISCLSAADLVASKLLANSDRQADGCRVQPRCAGFGDDGFAFTAVAGGAAKSRVGIWRGCGSGLGQSHCAAAATHGLARALHAGHGHADAQGAAVAKSAGVAARGA